PRAGRRQPRPPPDAGRGADRLARPSTADERGEAQARHHRRAGPPAGPHEPAAVDRVAALLWDARPPPGPGRVAVEDRPLDAVRWLRTVATRVVAPTDARAGHAVAGRPRTAGRGDGLGH